MYEQKKNSIIYNHIKSNTIETKKMIETRRQQQRVIKQKETKKYKS